MKFAFRLQVQSSAGPVHKPAVGFRAVSMHACEVTEAAERFMNEQFAVKRAHMFRVSHRQLST